MKPHPKSSSFIEHHGISRSRSPVYNGLNYSPMISSQFRDPFCPKQHFLISPPRNMIAPFAALTVLAFRLSPQHSLIDNVHPASSCAVTLLDPYVSLYLLYADLFDILFHRPIMPL